MHTSSVSCTVAFLSVGSTLAGVLTSAVAVVDSEHSFLGVGATPPPSSSRGLFLGVSSTKVGFRGEQVAWWEMPAVTWRLVAFFSGLPDTLDDLGDIWMLRSSDPRTRLFVGVAITFIINLYDESVRTRCDAAVNRWA